MRLSIIALGMLVAIGAASGGDSPYGGYGTDNQNSAPIYDQYGQSPNGQPVYDSQYGSTSSNQVLAPPTTNNYYNYYNDWLSPGPQYYSYPTYYNYNNYWWHNDDYWWYNHNPKYYYTTPVAQYYTWYPAAYSWGPWYGLGSMTYQYSSSWTYHSGGFFFDP